MNDDKPKQHPGYRIPVTDEMVDAVLAYYQAVTLSRTESKGQPVEAKHRELAPKRRRGSG